MHQYSMANWLVHLRQLSTACKTPERLPESCQGKLVSFLTTLCEKHSRLMQNQNWDHSDLVVNARDKDSLTAFHNLPDLCHLAQLMWQYERETNESLSLDPQGTVNFETLS